jgi:hypothetical protein
MNPFAVSALKLQLNRSSKKLIVTLGQNFQIFRLKVSNLTRSAQSYFIAKFSAELKYLPSTNNFQTVPATCNAGHGFEFRLVIYSFSGSLLTGQMMITTGCNQRSVVCGVILRSRSRHLSTDRLLAGSRAVGCDCLLHPHSS